MNMQLAFSVAYQATTTSYVQKSSSEASSGGEPGGASKLAKGPAAANAIPEPLAPRATADSSGLLSPAYLAAVPQMAAADAAADAADVSRFGSLTVTMARSVSVNGIGFFAPAPGQAPIEGSGPAEVAPAPAPGPVAGGATPAAGDPAGDPVDASAVKVPALQMADAGEFDRFRLKYSAASLETSLALSLTTREGDRVTIDFSQIQAMSEGRFKGRDAEGGRLGVKFASEDMQRLVNIEVSGDISEAEKAAIDEVLAQVLEAANTFFSGSGKDAAARLQDMEFDGATLLDFSLNLGMSRSTSFTQAYMKGDEGLSSLSQRDSQVRQGLEFLADSQRQLVDAAREVLDDKSAATLVRGLLPSLLDGPREPLAA